MDTPEVNSFGIRMTSEDKLARIIRLAGSVGVDPDPSRSVFDGGSSDANGRRKRAYIGVAELLGNDDSIGPFVAAACGTLHEAMHGRHVERLSARTDPTATRIMLNRYACKCSGLYYGVSDGITYDFERYITQPQEIAAQYETTFNLKNYLGRVFGNPELGEALTVAYINDRIASGNECIPAGTRYDDFDSMKKGFEAAFDSSKNRHVKLDPNDLAHNILRDLSLYAGKDRVPDKTVLKNMSKFMTAAKMADMDLLLASIHIAAEEHRYASGIPCDDYNIRSKPCFERVKFIEPGETRPRAIFKALSPREVLLQKVLEDDTKTSRGPPDGPDV